ncbi:OLC1v1026601C1 [Oldenlandia corymbosa var. corymbosa]|uniref:OLC1v1026601C1 n=1 Tax=Oldenlandia corymbosa var. corymbosa TaxID=529605 RepID=A0AAV1C7E5_OLDCO|nr:OLC1v1026601C1 [Oldenlandia corymbosa var. corymbosa]
MNHGFALTAQSRTIFSKLLNHTQQRNLPKGQSLHAHLIKTGLFSSTFLSNNLVNLYSKCHRLHEARLVFQEIQDKDVVSWNCLINGFSQLGTLDSSLSVAKLFKQMRQSNFLPNSHTFSGIFAALSALEDPSVGRQAHVLVVKTADSSDVFVNSSLLNMYCKMGLVDEGRQLFDEMPERNSVSWATMISGYATQRRVKDACGLFRLMLDEGEEDVNEFVLTSVFSAIALPEFIDVGKQIHCLAFKMNFLSVISVGNAVVTMYAKCGNLDDAVKVFELSNDKNSITWSAMVTGYAQTGNGEKALSLFSNMHSYGIVPSEYTLVGVLNACSDIEAALPGKQVHGYLLKLGYEAHMFVMTALVDMYAKCGNVCDAQKGFSHLQEPDLVLWTSMIGGYVQNGDFESAMSLYCKMQMEFMAPNELTVASVLKACSSLACLEQGKQIHAHTIKYGFSLEAPIGSALATMYAKCGSLDDGNNVFWRMPSRDVISWNAMISGLSHNGQGVEALELFEDMRTDSTKPDYVTFINVLSACSHMGLVEKGWEYFRMMSDEYGLPPKVDHYACMVDLLGRAGKLYEAKEFIESATIDHGLSLWRILLSACRNHRNYELGAYAGEKLVELGSPESSTYVLLSSIYSALGRLNDVERVRRSMNLRGVNKEPGCSWIELKSRVHVFVAGDLSHPHIEQIKTKLRKLTKVMKDEDYQYI